MNEREADIIYEMDKVKDETSKLICVCPCMVIVVISFRKLNQKGNVTCIVHELVPQNHFFGESYWPEPWKLPTPVPEKCD